MMGNGRTTNAAGRGGVNGLTVLCMKENGGMIACMAMVCINLLILQHEGEWKDGKRNGNGSMKYTTGKVYAGEWKDNRRNGKGVCKFVNGHVYEGEWRNDCMNGNGIYIFLI
jgi:hypothetical protein